MIPKFEKGGNLPKGVHKATINLWLETYQMTRDFESRGIVEVIIDDQK